MKQPSAKPTPSPWYVRFRCVQGEIVDGFVAAPATNGFSYDAELVGDDEYTGDDSLGRNLADAHLISPAPKMHCTARRIDRCIAREARRARLWIASRADGAHRAGEV